MFGGNVPGGSTRRIDAELEPPRQCAIDVRARVKKDLHHRDAVQRLRLDMLDIVDVGGQRTFVVRRDAVGHVLGGKAVIRPDDADYRDVDVREDIGGRAQDRERADDEDQHGENHEGIWAAQRELDDPHDGFLKRGGWRRGACFCAWRREARASL
jgi:hypothetical protein